MNIEQQEEFEFNRLQELEAMQQQEEEKEIEKKELAFEFKGYSAYLVRDKGIFTLRLRPPMRYASFRPECNFISNDLSNLFTQAEYAKTIEGGQHTAIIINSVIKYFED
jgi:hypothetical protein